MSINKQNRQEVFTALQEIISSVGRISDVVHRVTKDTEARKSIDDEVEKISEQCVTISENLSSS
ncbi:MAG: hypothetical protein ACSLFB_02315 [Acidimicrobiales bacterium]